MPALTVTYTSPTNPPFTLTTPLDTDSTPSPITTHLSSLRTAILSAQESINRELTDRMDQDNKAAAAVSTKGAVNDQKEEDNYGEEVQEDED